MDSVDEIQISDCFYKGCPALLIVMKKSGAKVTEAHLQPNEAQSLVTTLVEFLS